MGNGESSHADNYRMHNAPVKLPMPEPRELDERFLKVLKSMNLPPDKITVLKGYDNEKKWELICDQDKVFAKNPPQVYIQALLGYLDPTLGKKRFRKRIENSTKTLKELEISLRTNQIEWVWEFLNDENRGLDVLVDYLAFAQCAVVYGSFPGGAKFATVPKGKSTSMGDVSALNYSSGSSSLNRSNLSSTQNFRRTTLPNRRTLKNSSTIATRDDVHVCITCLRAIMNYKYGFSLVMEHPQCINEIALSLNNKSLRTKSLVLELLAAVCLVRGGHEIILQAFDNFKIVCSEPRRFTKLMQYFKSESENIDFMVSCMQFINIVVHSVEDLNYRVHLQHEFTLLGLDEYIESMKNTESDNFKRQLQAYLDNMFSIRNLLEDSELKVTALERVEQLEDQLLSLNEKFQEQEYENMTKIVELEKQLSESTKAIKNMKGTGAGVYALPGVHIDGMDEIPMPANLDIPQPLYSSHLGVIGSEADRITVASMPHSPDPNGTLDISGTMDSDFESSLRKKDNLIPVGVLPSTNSFHLKSIPQDELLKTDKYIYVPYETWKAGSFGSIPKHMEKLSMSDVSSSCGESDASAGFSSDSSNHWSYVQMPGQTQVNWNYRNLANPKFSKPQRESGYHSNDNLTEEQRIQDAESDLMMQQKFKMPSKSLDNSDYSSVSGSSESSVPSRSSNISSCATSVSSRSSTNSFPRDTKNRSLERSKSNSFSSQHLSKYPVLPGISELSQNYGSESDLIFVEQNKLPPIPNASSSVPNVKSTDELPEPDKSSSKLPPLSTVPTSVLQQIVNLNRQSPLTLITPNRNPPLDSQLQNYRLIVTSKTFSEELLSAVEKKKSSSEETSVDVSMQAYGAGSPMGEGGGIPGPPKLPPIKVLPGSVPEEPDIPGLKVKTKDFGGLKTPDSSGIPPPPPMMSSSAGIPPPPPPPGIGIPPPPPAMGGIPNLPGGAGLNALPGGLKIKQRHQTKYRLPVLNWKTIKPDQVAGTVFNELDDEAVLNEIDLNAFEEMFKTRAQDSEADRVRMQKIAEAQQKRGTSLIDVNRARNLAITLRKIGLTTEQICRAVYSYDLESLPLEYVEMLPRFVPNDMELRAFKQYEKDGHPFELLAAEDKFMWLFGRVERLQQRLNIMIFLGNFNDNIMTLTPQLASVIAASMSIKSSLKLKKVFEIILAFGNYMNSGKRGAVYGFKLQSLDALLDTKSTDKKQSLLHYIVSVISTYYPDIQDFYQEMRYIERASKVSLENILSDVNLIRNGLSLTEREYETHEHPVLKEFLQQSKDKVQKLLEDANTAQEAYKEVVEYFGETQKAMPPETFFPMVDRFIKAYIKAQDDIDNWRKADNKRKAAKSHKKEKASKDRRNGGKQSAEFARSEEDRMIAELRSKNKKKERGAIESKDGAIEDNIQYLKSEPYRRADTHQRSFRKKNKTGRAKVSTML